MKEFQIKMKLTKPARKSGGDRYEGEVLGQFESKHLSTEKLVLYFPQSISRATGGIPAQELMVKITYG